MFLLAAVRNISSAVTSLPYANILRISSSATAVLVSAENTYLSIGDFADVKITSAEEFDLYGELV